MPKRQAATQAEYHTLPGGRKTCGGTWWNLVELGGTWWNLVELGGTWWNLVESRDGKYGNVT